MQVEIKDIFKVVAEVELEALELLQVLLQDVIRHLQEEQLLLFLYQFQLQLIQ